VTNSNLPAILHHFKLWPVIGQIFAIDRGVPRVNASTGADPLWISRYNLPLQKPEGLSYQMLKPHKHIFIRLNTRMWRTVMDGRMDRQTDGRTESLWLLQHSVLQAMRTHCVQFPIFQIQ